jgi:hypothetical protein
LRWFSGSWLCWSLLWFCKCSIRKHKQPRPSR